MAYPSRRVKYRAALYAAVLRAARPARPDTRRGAPVTRRRRALPEIVFNGPDGRLEGRYQHGRGGKPPVALVLHPHPLHGGSMNNKVTYTLYQACARMGFSTLRFNFRGVGRSQGAFDEGEGELSDAAAALDWLQQRNRDARACWIAGFSFGAWIAMQLLMRRPEVAGFVAVAPPAGHYDFSFLAPCPVSGLFVHGSEDDVAPPETARELALELSNQRGVEVAYSLVEGADHYFDRHLEKIAQLTQEYVKTRTAQLAG